MKYNNEEEFLKNYDESKYEHQFIRSEVLLLSISNGIQNNYRKLKDKFCSVFLVKRKEFPDKNKWSLPGIFIKNTETCEEAARRILEDVNLQDIFMEQLYTFDKVNRDPRTRILSASYLALTDKEKLNNIELSTASWFNISYKEENNIIYVTLDNGNEKINFSVKKILKEKTTKSYRYEIIQNESLAFDHASIIVNGIARLKNKVMYTDIAFNMISEYFTLGELQQVYEVILNKKLLDPAFRRIIANKVEKTEKVKTGEGHRPSVLYKYKN